MVHFSWTFHGLKIWLSSRFGCMQHLVGGLHLVGLELCLGLVGMVIWQGWAGDWVGLDILFGW